jgi:hypothetical protein
LVAGLALATVVVAACGSHPREEHRFRISREGLLVTATSYGGPRFQQELFSYTKTLEIRSDPERLESVLERPYGTLMADDGGLLVADDSRLQILRFDRNGAFVGAIGRAGRGPGEFQSIQLLDVRSDTITVYDLVLGRTTRHLTSGELIDVITLPYNMPRGYSSTAVVQYIPLQDGRKLAIERSMQSGTDLQYRATMLSTHLDTLWTESTPQVRTLYRVEAVPGFSAMIKPIEYGAEPAMDFRSGTGLVISPGDRPELMVYSLEGALVRKIRVDMELQPVSAEERRRVIDRYDQRIADAEGIFVALRRAEKEALTFSDLKPAWTSLDVDDRGYYWLAVPETSQERRDAGGTLFRVLAPDGEYLGDTRWPTTLSNARVSRGHLLVIVTDPESDEPIPTVFRIEPAIPGLDYPQ